MTKILVTGANGQLGKELQDVEGQYSKFKFVFFDRQILDITNREKVNEAFEEIKPQYVLNCAAFTAVDKAETEVEAAMLVNRDAAANLAAASAANGARFLHISTDYVFDGTSASPLKEDYPTNPINTYGKSKLEGEQSIAKLDKDAIIIRTSWMYSIHGNNFVKTMLRLMASRPEVSVVGDQIGSPTYAADLANAIMRIVGSEMWIPGIYHFSNDAAITWYDFASEIKRRSRSQCLVRAITTDQYPTPAKRPKFSVMDKSKIHQTYSIEIKDWRESLEVCLDKLIQ
jgi:dTDP-4-dehydrorhamnose reductase